MDILYVDILLYVVLYLRVYSVYKNDEPNINLHFYYKIHTS